MKRFIFIVTVILSAVAMVSCGKDDKGNKQKQEQIVGDEDTGAYDQDMGHPGSAHTLSSSQVQEISGTPWHIEQWFDGGSNTLTFWNNGTFKASWNRPGDYLVSVGYTYSINNPVKHTDKKFAADYNYKKFGNGGDFSWIGAYGWTVEPLTEWFIVDDSFDTRTGMPSYAKEMGNIDLDYATYTTYAVWKENYPSINGNQDFLQIWCVRSSKRSKGHMSLHAHFKKFAALFHGQTEAIPVSTDYDKTVTVSFGKLFKVTLAAEAGQNAVGGIEYNHFNVTDNQQ